MDRIKYLKKLFKNILQNCLQYVFFIKKESNKFLDIDKKNQEAEEKNKKEIFQNIKEFLILSKDYNPLKNVKYNIKPLKFYINKNIDRLLSENINIFKKLDINPKIGIEIEFYSLENVKNIKKFYNEILNFSKKNDIDILNIEKERGHNQFEIQFKPYLDLLKLINDYNKIKEFLIGLEDYKITFEVSPFYYDISSSLQVNITLNKNGENLFARIYKDGKKQESQLLKNCVAGLLKKNNKFLPLYISSKDCLKRYDFEFCKMFYEKGKIPGPVFNSWGINNRTCSIRIPVPKIFNDFAKYDLEDKNNRRIEFRVPSSNSNIKLVIYGVLESLLFGIENDLEPPKPIFDNIFDNTYDCEKIEII